MLKNRKTSLFFCFDSVVKLQLTFSRYKQFGIKEALSFGFAKSSKYKPIFPLSQMPKLLVACVSGCTYSFGTYSFFVLVFKFNSTKPPRIPTKTFSSLFKAIEFGYKLPHKSSLYIVSIFRSLIL